MSIVSTTEQKLETAWISYLSTAEGISGVAEVFVYGKELESFAYPCIAVRCLGSESSLTDIGLETTDMELTIYTEAMPDKDSDCSELYGLVGAIRQAIRVPQAKDSISNAVNGLSIKGILKYKTEYEQLISSEQDTTLLDKRIARFVITQLAISYDTETSA